MRRHDIKIFIWTDKPPAEISTKERKILYPWWFDMDANKVHNDDRIIAISDYKTGEEKVFITPKFLSSPVHRVMIDFLLKYKKVYKNKYIYIVNKDGFVGNAYKINRYKIPQLLCENVTIEEFKFIAKKGLKKEEEK